MGIDSYFWVLSKVNLAKPCGEFNYLWKLHFRNGNFHVNSNKILPCSKILNTINIFINDNVSISKIDYVVDYIFLSSL